MAPDPQFPGPQHPGSPAGGSRRTSKLARASLILGFIGGFLPCPFGPIAIGLGIAALIVIGRNPGLTGRSDAIVGIVLPLTLGSLVGITAVTELRKFIRANARRYSECRSNLKSLHTAQKSYFLEKGRYSTLPAEVGFSPERGNRYAYFLDVRGSLQDRSSPQLSPPGENDTGIGIDRFKWVKARPITMDGVNAALGGRLRPGVQGRCPECSFVAICAGNLDDDDTLDVWSISSEDRTGAGGEPIPAGMPHNDVEDLDD